MKGCLKDVVRFAPVRPFDKVLVANRGEIALRIMRTLRELDIQSVAVFSQADREAAHVLYADEAYCIGPAPSLQSYLCQDKLIEVAQKSGAQAVHPGYGFLSERATFARAVRDAGLVWIGPPPEAIEAMGDKVTARKLMTAAGVPVVPGTPDAVKTVEEAREAAKSIGFPILIKASAGGGGKGMRLVEDPKEFEVAFESASREALAAFGNGQCYLERFLVNPRHVEFQVFSDSHGHTVHLFERDCSVQRRHQKVVEETPCPVLREETRQKMGEVAVRAAEAVGYENAGTIEFLLSADHEFFFLEMNTRLQVEHPVTEWVTGLDLVQLQIKVAQGEPLPFKQSDIRSSGASIEVRLYAEDPANNFLPSPGEIRRLSWPDGPGVRVDAGVYEGVEVSPHYDPLIAKLTVWANTREVALRRMERALEETLMGGIRTNLDFLRAVLRHPAFKTGQYDNGFVECHLDELMTVTSNPTVDQVAFIAGVIAANQRDETRTAVHASENGDGVSESRWRLLGLWNQLRG